MEHQQSTPAPTKKKAYFIGIAGAGMSATARLLQTLGWTVSGSDEGAYPPVTTYLEQCRIPYFTTYNMRNVPDAVDLVVVGKHAGLTREENEEVALVHDRGLAVRSFPEVLRDVTKNTRNIVCAGSHGKSTCTSMLAWCLVDHDPGFFIGALPYGFDFNAQAGTGDLFVLEGDEYPTSNTDNTSKFLYYNASDLLLTSLEHDHLNIFDTQEAYSAPYLQLIAGLPDDGVVVANGSDSQIQTSMPRITKRVVTYSTDAKTDWTTRRVSYGEETSFDLVHNDTVVTTLSTTLLGKHNIENITGVSALLLEKNLISPDRLRERMRTFTGVKRRLDKRTTTSSVPLYEGFGSSRSKARSAVDAMQLHFPEKRLLVIFEPHAISWRKKAYSSNYQSLFTGAEKVYVYLDSVPEPIDPTFVDGATILASIENGGSDATPLRADLTPLTDEIQEGDLILCLSSGNVDGMLPTLTEMLEQRFPV